MKVTQDAFFSLPQKKREARSSQDRSFRVGPDVLPHEVLGLQLFQYIPSQLLGVATFSWSKRLLVHTWPRHHDGEEEKRGHKQHAWLYIKEGARNCYMEILTHIPMTVT